MDSMAGDACRVGPLTKQSAESGFSGDSTITKRKPPTIPKLKAKAATLLQKLVRMKAAKPDGLCKCVTCGREDHWKTMDGGHFISRTYSYHVLREENVHPQCKRCNRFFTGCHDDYRRYMVDMYGEEFVEWLSDTKRNIVKWTRADLMASIQELQHNIKLQEQRLL